MTTKPIKKTAVYSVKYKKGVTFNTLVDLNRILKQDQIVIYILEEGHNSDETGFFSIKIDNIKV